MWDHLPVVSFFIMLLSFFLVSDGKQSKFYNDALFGSQYMKTSTIQMEGVKTYYFEQLVDHFSFTKPDKFSQRYLVDETHWRKPGGPIFFYTGNEGDITWFMNNTGLMFDWAPKFQAMLVFAEHRYYGKSMPYGKDSFKDLDHLGYLTSEQALADFVTLIDNIKSTTAGASDSPVIAIGGSYGGMLAAWLRIKYPHKVVGSLAASAPVWNFEDLTPCNGFMSVVTEDFKMSGKNCAENIRKSWSVILKAAETAEGRIKLTSLFNLCETLKSGDELIEWLTTAWVYMAMVDYPYPAEFLSPLPAWPIKVTCSYLNRSDFSETDLLKAIKDAANVFYNYTGSVKCFSFNNSMLPDLGIQGWNFQMAFMICFYQIHGIYQIMLSHVGNNMASSLDHIGLLKNMVERI